MTDYTEVLRAAFLLPVSAERPMGCARIYVAITGKSEAKLIALAAKRLGLIWQKRSHYGTSNAIYIGYDNHDGIALARATAVVAALKAVEVQSYRDEHGD